MTGKCPLHTNFPLCVYLFFKGRVSKLTHQLSITRHPDTNFTVIINPSNGPGSAAWPSASYIDAVKALNVHTNVQTLGYIDAAQGTRDNASIRTEIATYAGWANVSTNLGLDGIYFDHTPWQYSDGARAFLENITAVVRRDADNAGFGQTPIVVHNPGRVPDKGLTASRPDITVVFEGAYADLPRKTKLHHLVEQTGSDREELALLVHSAPADLGTGGLRKVVDDVRRDVEWLFVTDLSENVYDDYGSVWEQWLNVMW